MESTVGFRGTKDNITFANNAVTPITTADIGKPVKINDITDGSVILAGDGEVFVGIVQVVDSSGVGVICGGCVECTPLAADAIATAQNFAVAGTGGTVKRSATATNAISIYAADGKVWLRLS
ncbi:MAG TPA: hypothetical protein PLE35_12080 [Lentisphaeria bacterium]|nr:hypothetical protein [Lentisphaeria bacterium]